MMCVSKLSKPVLLASVIWPATPALALSPCTWITSGTADSTIEDTGDWQCKSALGQSGPSRYCLMHYPYRATEAARHFANLHGTLTACLGATDPVTDAQVNHPDSYDTFTWNQGQVTLALKDKAQLSQSVVILRVEGHPRP